MEIDFLHFIQGFHNRYLDSIMMFITKLGNAGVIWFVWSVFLFALPPMKRILKKDCDDEYLNKIRKRRIVGVAALIALILTAIIANIGLKSIVGRPRPYQVDSSVELHFKCSDSSFPSGHTASSFAAAMVIFFAYKKAGIVAIVLASLIAFSRMYFFVHFPTDILGGIVVGVLIAKVVNYFTEKKLSQS